MRLASAALAGMIFVKYILQIPAIYVGAHFYGVIGIFVAIAMVNFFVGLFLHVISWFYAKSCATKTAPPHTMAHTTAHKTPPNKYAAA